MAEDVQRKLKAFTDNVSTSSTHKKSRREVVSNDYTGARSLGFFTASAHFLRKDLT